MKDWALREHKQALAILREVGDRAGEGLTLNNIGYLYGTLGRTEKALRRYERALAIQREIGDRAGEAITLNNIGSVYRTLGQLSEAVAVTQKALIIRRETNNRWDEGLTLFNLGFLLDEMGRTAEAVSYLEQCVALEEAIEHPDLESDRAVLERTRGKSQPAEEQHQAEYERQQTAQAAEQKRQQEEALRATEQRPRSNLRLTLAPGMTMDFVHVPAGKFLMGSNRNKDDEKPQHTVEIPDDYWIGRYPVTNEQFARFVTAVKYKFDLGQWQQKTNHPVVSVSWRDAMAYCQWLNATLRGELKDLALRLPTEAEWEKAARGTQGNEWPWGNEFDKNKCNSHESSKGGTTPVGAYSPQGDSPYGAADMAGNVWEWTTTIWGPWDAKKNEATLKKYPYPYNASDGREELVGDDNIQRVLRGGSFIFNQDVARCAYRDGFYPINRGRFFGFRVMVAPIFP